VGFSASLSDGSCTHGTHRQPLRHPSSRPTVAQHHCLRPKIACAIPTSRADWDHQPCGCPGGEASRRARRVSRGQNRQKSSGLIGRAATTMQSMWCAHCAAYVNHDPWDAHHRVVDGARSKSRWAPLLASLRPVLAAEYISRSAVASLAGGIARFSAEKQAWYLIRRGRG
jgi:hypothetical protein